MRQQDNLIIIVNSIIMVTNCFGVIRHNFEKTCLYCLAVNAELFTNFFPVNKC